jgi:hypothetical protein
MDDEDGYFPERVAATYDNSTAAGGSEPSRPGPQGSMLTA